MFLDTVIYEWPGKYHNDKCDNAYRDQLKCSNTDDDERHSELRKGRYWEAGLQLHHRRQRLLVLKHAVT